MTLTRETIPSPQVKGNLGFHARRREPHIVKPVEPSWPRLIFFRDDLPCKGTGLWPRVRQELLNHHWRYRVASYKWQTAFRSFRGHMRLLSPKGMPALVHGGVMEPADATPERVAEIDARSAGTRSLSATYPWVDLVDQQIYLMGFRAGLQQALCTSDILEPNNPTT